ncbi:hypothetical protein [Oscillatoria sp. FACHB-1406]|uniref:hypothetical protein n=1 Tax=Oscillatoria sp. FACHB-1406 TaxID=2692846 RepID=UPI001686CB5E|nr:hypothetical protein [Oscillatoria sp. FACHB-1406]MBD2578136.1 hypothetical protein [Oscillatoria sp. FACHB-1406]
MFFIPLYKHFLDSRKPEKPETLAPISESRSETLASTEKATEAANRVRESYYLERRSLL